MTTQRTEQQHEEWHARRRSLIAELDALSRRQRALIESDDSEGLLTLLDSRQVVIERLEEMETRRPAGVQAHASDEALLASIRERDAQDQSRLVDRRDQVAAQLAELTSTRRALSAYAPREGTARFHDGAA